MSVDAYVCHSPAPPCHGKAQPPCNRIRGHAGPHRIIRARDFATVAEWQAGARTYDVEPPAPKRRTSRP